MARKLHSSQKQRISTEMYLKTIFLLREKAGEGPKLKDLVKELGHSKGSVSEMVAKLKEDGFIEYESFGSISLTSKGLEKAKNVVRKYQVIREFLVQILKTEPSKAHDEACNLEHAFSDESIAKLNILMKFMKKA